MRDRLAEVVFEDTLGDTVIATVAGEIDGSNASEVRRAVAERVPSTARSLVIDLTRTAYVDSTGVELLFELARRLSSRRQTFTVIVPPGSGVRRVLELCDIGSVGSLVETREQALAAGGTDGSLQ
jgi:anti-sigma B factor antagonist